MKRTAHGVERGRYLNNYYVMELILLIILVLLLVGALPTWPHSKSWGYYPSGGLGLILLHHPHHCPASRGITSRRKGPRDSRVSSRIEYEVRSPLILLLNIRAHASEPQRILKETFTISPKVESELVVTEPDKNRFDRVKVTESETRAHRLSRRSGGRS